MRKRKAAPQDKNQDTLLGEIQRLRKQVHQLELERDILTKANELIKKDLGISFLKLKNREKTLIVDALKGRCEQVPDMRSCLSSGAMEQGSS